jgi:hypothetical protein
VPRDIRYTPQPRTSKYLTFEGLYEEQVLGVFAIIRGFAPLQDLARVSVAYKMSPNPYRSEVEGFQRAIDDAHAEQIKKYLESTGVRFLPEVILSVRTNYMPEGELSSRGEVRNSTDNEIIVRQRWRDKPIYQVGVKIDAIDNIVEQQRIRRIDGNHRLERAKELTEDPALIKKYFAPFCMILLKPSGNADDDYTESLIFHDINSTALPLESEHALRLILGQSNEYRMADEAEFNYDPIRHLTRRLRDWAQNSPRSIRERFADRLVSLSGTTRSMLDMRPALRSDFALFNSFADELFNALTEISSNLDQAQIALFRTDYFIDLAARVWMEKEELPGPQRILETIEYLKGIDRWLGGDGLNNLKSSGRLSEQLLEIYKAVQNRIPKRVFLARWYPAMTDGVQRENAQKRLKAIKRSLEDLERDCHFKLNLELIDMETKPGGAFPIHRKMYEAVESSDIILIDLTGLRPNVCIEAGFALQHHEKGRLIFLHHRGSVRNEVVPFDLNTFRYEQVTDTGDIPDKLKTRFVEILKEAGVNI